MLLVDDLKRKTTQTESVDFVEPPILALPPHMWPSNLLRIPLYKRTSERVKENKEDIDRRNKCRRNKVFYYFCLVLFDGGWATSNLPPPPVYPTHWFINIILRKAAKEKKERNKKEGDQSITKSVG